MNYKTLIAKTREKVLYANDKVELFNNTRTLKHPANEKQRKIFEEEFDYYDTLDTILGNIELKLERWLELLETDGINSKSMVANDIQQVLKELRRC